ncbi:hypothetical protein TNCT_725961 [Trichonephila clavata]|uniref:Uncharacterized protein n=1 Tax=Trichonephila clavata TaxID=2740835 RepID=A0A8X6IH33_TRICU|nr:hypothetical protein TNCT_725961 [Trichonephila clavata]
MLAGKEREEEAMSICSSVCIGLYCHYYMMHVMMMQWLRSRDRLPHVRLGWCLHQHGLPRLPHPFIYQTAKRSIASLFSPDSTLHLGLPPLDVFLQPPQRMLIYSKG